MHGRLALLSMHDRMLHGRLGTCTYYFQPATPQLHRSVQHWIPAIRTGYYSRSLSISTLDSLRLTYEKTSTRPSTLLYQMM